MKVPVTFTNAKKSVSCATFLRIFFAGSSERPRCTKQSLGREHRHDKAHHADSHLSSDYRPTSSNNGTRLTRPPTPRQIVHSNTAQHEGHERIDLLVTLPPMLRSLSTEASRRRKRTPNVTKDDVFFTPSQQLLARTVFRLPRHVTRDTKLTRQVWLF